MYPEASYLRFYKDLVSLDAPEFESMIQAQILRSNPPYHGVLIDTASSYQNVIDRVPLLSTPTISMLYDLVTSQASSGTFMDQRFFKILSFHLFIRQIHDGLEITNN